MPHSALPYRNGVGIMMLNAENRVFVAKRIDTLAEAWQMPQGGMDDGETPEQSAMRELYEETGTDKAVIIAESRDWYYYDLPAELIGKIWKGKYRGQKQKWFVMRFLGADSDINIHTPHPEFSEWRWVDMQSLPDVIVPFKRTLYQALVDEFGTQI
jgi:putative (di)nucleoside polyphosphate hydrolase